MSKATTTETVTVTHKGWLLFCPCYLAEGFEADDALCPYPRFRLGWLLDLAFAWMQFQNWIVSFFNPEACGFWVAGVKPLPKPKTIRFKRINHQ